MWSQETRLAAAIVERKYCFDIRVRQQSVGLGGGGCLPLRMMHSVVAPVSRIGMATHDDSIASQGIPLKIHGL